MSLLTTDRTVTDFQGVTCTKCGLPVDNYDPGSMRYQEHYGHPLPAICDNCLNLIFNKIK